MSFTEGKGNILKTVHGFTRQNWKRILIWILAALVCMYCSFLTAHLSRYNLPWCTTQEFPHTGRWNPQVSLPDVVELQPGESLEQAFTAMGNIVGSCSELYLKIPGEVLPQEVRIHGVLWSERKQMALTETEMEITEVTEDGIAALVFPEPVILKSAEDYRIIITNASQTDVLPLEIDHSVQSGVLTAKGETLDGALTYGFLRTSMYTPSILVTCMILLTNITVLTGLALVLFCNVKEHILYLVLAVGFGIVTLFDLTPLYGFDMRFQFDSAYVVSNELLGLEGAIQMPSQADPEVSSTWYYRRACDDYSMFQFFQEESVSDNYTDMVAGIKNLRAKPEKQELILVESNQGFIGDQRYILYLPQAIGFAVARLMGVGFLPMVQAGRIVPYMLFVALMFFAIRSAPFGKRVFLILALLPSVLTETISINRDGVIFGMSFFLVAKVLQAAYADHKPTLWNWIPILAVSALLAPCKAVYLPMSFFWLLVVYRQYLHQQKVNWSKVALWFLAGLVPIMLIMSFSASLSPVKVLLSILKGGESGAAPATYTLPYVFANLPRVCTVLWNTLRQELGHYLMNAIQLYAIDIGSNDGLSLLILFLLLVECCHSDEKYQMIRSYERYFSLVIAVGVFLLTALASLQWTNIGSYTLFGMQGRYLIPVLPMMCFFLMNNRFIKIQGNTATAVKACCCIFPAIYLMNMYLWTMLQ